MRIVCISDTHLLEPSLPEGDILIHAGDLTVSISDSIQRSYDELVRAAGWLSKQRHKHKIVIAGNHERCLDAYQAGFEWAMKSVAMVQCMDLWYLCDAMVEVDGLKIYGTPWTTPFYDWAFQKNDEERRIKMAAIPDRIDVLVSHGPPVGVLDKTHSGRSVGCRWLREAVMRVQPKLHVFGHIHDSYGMDALDGVPTMFVNAAICPGQLIGPTHLPVVIDL